MMPFVKSDPLSLSARAESLAESATLALAAKAKALAATGRDIINMGVGEPDFDAPLAAQTAAHDAIDSGLVKYTPAAGTASLRSVIAEQLTRERGAPIESKNVVVCHSAKHALSHTLLALCDPGDDVLLLPPVWGSYDEQVKFAGARPVHVAPLLGGKCAPDLDGIRAAIGPKTRGIMLNTPSNPSGYVWSAAEISALCEIVLEHDLWLISDEIYAKLVFDGAEHVSPIAHSPEMAARTIIVDGASKVFAMTGYRIGFLAAPVRIAKAVADMQSQLSGCPNYVSQVAYEACLTVEPPEVQTMVAEFSARRDLIVDGLKALGLHGPQPRGAFYVFPDMSAHIDERGTEGLCHDLLESKALATVPGTVFGAPEHIRLSYALGRDALKEALVRLGSFLGK